MVAEIVAVICGTDARYATEASAAVDAARKAGISHVLLAGPPGLGKTSLAQIIRRELDVGIRQVAGPALERKGDIAAILTTLEPRDILFIDDLVRAFRIAAARIPPASACAVSFLTAATLIACPGLRTGAYPHAARRASRRTFFIRPRRS